MTTEDIKFVLKKLRRRMDTLMRLQQDLHEPPTGRQREIINNIAIQGRSVTNILQNLHHIKPKFDEWYAPYRKQMEQDELMSFFYQLRNESLKEGEDRIRGVSVRPGGLMGGVSLGLEEIIYTIFDEDGNEETVTYPKPANAIFAFLGDSEGGGSGWVVKNPDGSESHVYVKIPPKLLIYLSHLQIHPSHISENKLKNFQQHISAICTYLIWTT